MIIKTMFFLCNIMLPFIFKHVILENIFKNTLIYKNMLDILNMEVIQIFY